MKSLRRAWIVRAACCAACVPCAAVVVGAARLARAPEPVAHHAWAGVAPHASPFTASPCADTDPHGARASSARRALAPSDEARVAIPTAAMPTVEAPPGDLIARLGAVTRARGDARAVERAVDDVLGGSGDPGDVLALLETPLVDGDADALAGAVTTVEHALARDRGDRVVLEVLAALPRLRDASRARVALAASALTVEGAPRIGARFWPDLVALQRAHPARADDLAALFARLHEDRAGLEGRWPDVVAAARLVEYPSVAAAAVRCAWELDPHAAVRLTDELRAHDDLGRELEHELAQLTARRLAPSEAIDALAGRSTPVALAGLLALAERPDADEALRAEYDELAATGADERGRLHVVHAMRTAETSVLVDIARRDPSARVRERALLTLTSTRALDADEVSLLRALRDAGPDSIGAGACATAAGQVVVRSCGPARADALELLREIATDPRVAESERRTALDVLARHERTPDDEPPDQAGK